MKTLGLAIVLTSSLAVHASDALTQAEAAAQKDLDASIKELAATREAIKQERLPLSEELGRLENELASLKRTYDETTRSQGDRALELGNLEAANKLRQDEMVYVANLLDEYGRGFEGLLHVSEVPRFREAIDAAKTARDAKDLTMGEKLATQSKVVRASLDRLLDLVGGTRYPGRAVDAKGNVADGEFAAIGPVRRAPVRRGRSPRPSAAPPAQRLPAP